jgi:threonyl-tRNA synthetase
LCQKRGNHLYDTYIAYTLPELRQIASAFKIRAPKGHRLRTKKDYCTAIDKYNSTHPDQQIRLLKYLLGMKVDGAFYGPKIDIHLKDNLGRSHQCGTIQLDFNLPERFGLQYRSKEANKLDTPVIIHRAIFGSFERFFAILCEHYQGKWPMWLSPRQIKIIPVSKKFYAYAEGVKQHLFDEGYQVEVDSSGLTLNKKIRNAEVEQYNYILCVGNKEIQTNTVTVRQRDQEKQHNITVMDFIKIITDDNYINKI